MTDKVREALEAARDTLSAASRQLTDDHKIVLGGKRWGETAIAKIDAALAALDAPAEGEGWRTIDSAPRDGTVVLTVCMDAQRPRVNAAWWRDGWWRSFRPTLDKFQTENPFRWFPTHWRPLPSPPESRS